MSRWHAPSCTTPEIFIADGHRISCHSCARSCPPVQELLAQSSTAQHSIPTNKPLGHLNLRWPPSVPYVRSQASPEIVAQESRLEATGTAKCSGTREAYSDSTDSYDHSGSHVYDKLGTAEFRLICLPAAEDQHGLIHLELETFRLDDCPEYEPTSYAWGGEDGDSSPRCPIYVGEYYDVLLQTKNCWSMLQYLRPHRGIRMVWIDAICINQQDVHEREIQVAQMRMIYQNGRRVVAYLGSSTVYACDRRYRFRSGLHEFGPCTKNDSATLQQVLRHRYFSRLWVIQELLLSASLLIPIYDTDFLADNTLSRKIEISRDKIDWDDTEAPWFQYAASGQVFLRDEMLTVLRLTWTSQATDPRDKIFGILGLVDTKRTASGLTPDYPNDLETNNYSLIPDYSLSTLESLIGITAYVMITLGHWQILENAAGVNAIPGYPRWMPDYRDPLMWHSKNATENGDFERLREWYCSQCLCQTRAWNLSSSREAVSVGETWRDTGVKHTINSWALKEQRDSIEARYTQLQRLRAIMRAGDSVRDGLRIDPSTASLSIKLVRVLHLPSSPILVTDLGSLRVFKFSKASYSIFICTGPIALDELLGTGSVWLYLREIDDVGSSPFENAGSTIFFLRDAQTEKRSDMYELVCCCVCWDLVICPEPEHGELKETRSLGLSTEKSSSTIRNTISHTENEHIVRSNLWTCPLLYETPRAAIGMFLESFDLGSRLEGDIRKAFPSENTRVKDVLPLLQYLVDEFYSNKRTWHTLSAQSRHQFAQLYLSTLRKTSIDFSPSLVSPCEDNRVVDRPRQDWGCIFFTIQPSTWAEVSDYYHPERTDFFITTEYMNIRLNPRTAPTKRLNGKNGEGQKADHEGLTGWRRIVTIKELDKFGFRRSAEFDEIQTVYVSLGLSDIAQVLVRSQLFPLLCNLARFRPLTNEDETTMVQGMKDDYRNIYRHDWPESLMAELQLDCRPHRVQLV